MSKKLIDNNKQKNSVNISDTNKSSTNMNKTNKNSANINYTNVNSTSKNNDRDNKNKENNIKKSNDIENNVNTNNVNKDIEENDVTKIVDNNVFETLTKRDIRRIKRIKKQKSFSWDKAQRYTPNEKTGLDESEVKERIQNGYINYYNDKTTKSYWNIIASNVFTFFNLLCFLVGIALILVGSFENLFFMLIFTCNIVIGIVQEIKAKRTVEKISLVTSPVAKVVRCGEIKKIKVSEVVLDDILIYEFGDQICTDSIVIKGEIEVNESLLTGESESIKKKAGDLVLAGSYVTSGNCYARAERVAEENYTSVLTLKAKKYKKPESELLKSLRTIIKVIGVIILPLGALIFFNNRAIIGNDLKLLVTKSAGSIIGLIPAGLFLLTSLALAVGVIKLAKKKTLVQDLYGIEMLSRASVLCLDKTGTITDGNMQVKEVKMLNKEENLNDILCSFLFSQKTQNQTFNALKNYFGSSEIFSAKKVYEFNSQKKYSATTLENGKTYFLGATEFVLKEKDKKIMNFVDEFSKLGYRVLVLCETSEEIKNGLVPLNVTPVCLICLEERIRKEAKQTISWFNNNGVGVKIISGDNPLTVSEISKKVGVIGAEKYISLEGKTNEEVEKYATEYNIFGRVSPEQKQILVKALKKAGHNVAMTGDGVNDILALKEADCSISVASGSEAARNVSHLVLLDNNFLNLPAVVGEGRRVVNNIVNSASLFLMKTLFTFLLTVFCLIVGINYPFTPNQIILLENFTIGIPSFCLALQPNNEKIEGKFINKVAFKSIFYGLILFSSFVLCYVFDLYIFGSSSYETLASLTVTFVGLILLLKMCSPLNTYRLVLVLGMVALTLLSLIILPQSFFGFSEINVYQKIFIAFVTFLAYFVVSLKDILCEIKINVN